MPLIVDAHCDLAYNMLRFGRDYTLSASEIRKLEVGSQNVVDNEDATIGWPDYQHGQVAVIFSTLFATPIRFAHSKEEKQAYRDFDEAHKLYWDQMLAYYRMTDSMPDKFQLVKSTSDLDRILQHWLTPDSDTGHPVGMVMLMEGAEAIRQPSELEEWYEMGLRLIGPAWVGTRYCGGWKEPGPLTEDGRKLLRAMSDFKIILDLSHMDEQATVEALDIYDGPIVATHANCATLMPNSGTNRHLSDQVIEGIIEHDGVMGIVPFNTYLKAGWFVNKSPREEVSMQYLADHIDHICQLAGDSLHAGIGSDFDGGFGLQSIPYEMDTIADLQNLVSLLQERGYTEVDAANILGGNWLARLKRDLPAS